MREGFSPAVVHGRVVLLLAQLMEWVTRPATESSVGAMRFLPSKHYQEASIQMVLISVYWSCAQIDLSRPPNPDSL